MPHWERVPGLWYRVNDGGYVSTPRAPLLTLDQLRGDAWGLLPMDRYRAHNWQCFDGSPRQPYAAIYTSLGCPYSCSFCCINAPFGKSSYRMRDPQEVIAEVVALHDTYGVSTFKVIDEMFVLNRRHVEAICRGLAALPYAHELNLWAYARIDTVDRVDLALMRRAGFRWLALGIEAADGAVRDGADKTMLEADIVTAVATVQSHGINVIGNFIFGLPGDDLRTMAATLRLAMRLRCEFANFYSAMAYPGSQLYATAEPMLLPASWSGYAQHGPDCLPLHTGKVSGRDVLAFRDTAFDEYFRSKAYLSMVTERFGLTVAAQITEMLSHRLERRVA
jgi:anaerobic magnesium-protoporphyrin IX monomethyl ester cyclase